MPNKISKFTGFSADVPDFFNQLKENNNKLWFDEHKEFYQNNIREVNQAIVSEMAQFFISTGLPYFSDPKLSLFRINRDIRFSKNKEPYKTNTGIFFPYSKYPIITKDTDKPGLYFHLDTEEVFISGGIYMPATDTLKKTRDRIADDYQTLLDVVNSPQFTQEFGTTISGSMLKVVPRGFPKDHPAIELLKLKDYLVSSQLTYKDTQSEYLIELLKRKATTLAPFLEYFYDAIFD